MIVIGEAIIYGVNGSILLAGFAPPATAERR
jgi:hypothetical protein